VSPARSKEACFNLWCECVTPIFNLFPGANFQVFLKPALDRAAWRKPQTSLFANSQIGDQ